MPDDTPVTGFATYAAGQTLSTALLEKYFAAADKIVERLKAAAEKDPKDSSRERKALNELLDGLPGIAYPNRTRGSLQDLPHQDRFPRSGDGLAVQTPGA